MSEEDADLGYQQALKYGRDLAHLFVQEKAKRHDLELANQKLQAILETAPNGLAVLDERMRIVETNPRFDVIVAQDGGCVGCYLADALPSDELITALEAVSEEGPRFVEVEVSSIQPSKRTWHIIAAPLAAGGQRGWVISLHDLTERKRLEGLKEEFINIAAHELRTPLAIILGYTSVLRDDLEDQEGVTVAAIDAIIRAADWLTMVIDELIDFAAAKRKSSEEVGNDQFDVWTMVRRAVNSVRHQAKLKDVDVIVEAPSETLMVSGDRVILAQAIGHLLDNAIKYNRRGGQVVIRANQENGETHIEIEDTGVGIHLTDLEKIFDMFYQVEEHMTRSEGGLGLGLAIAQRGVELHGGTITVTSTPGQGSCFRIAFPPSGEQTPIPPQAHLETAHQQTLAYGRDLARAFAEQRALSRQLGRVAALGEQLLIQFDKLSSTNRPEDTAALLDEARALAETLVEAAAKPKND